MSLPILFSGTKNASSWAMRAWLALKHASLEFEEIVVDIRRPQRFENLRELRLSSPSATVPLLMVEDRSIFDSLAIMEFANDHSNGALLPADPLARAEARSIVAWQHSGLSAICSRISFESAFYPLKRRLSDEEQRQAAQLFEHLEKLLLCSGGPFLFGPLSLADLSLVPAVIRLTRHKLNLDAFPESRRWVDQVLGDGFVVEWMQAADSLPHIWFDDYLDGAIPDEWLRRDGS